MPEKMPEAMLEDHACRWLATELHDVRPRNLVPAILDLIAAGRISGGTRLPTVRDLAQALSVSHSSIASAWAELRRQGWIDTHRRGGTYVNAQKVAEIVGTAAPFTGWTSIDLANGTADPDLCPDLHEALLHGLKTPRLNSPARESITEALEAAVRDTWPFPAEAWTTAAGGSEGTLLAIQTALRSPSLVAVEQPTTPRILEALRLLGHTAVPVACDEHGPVPESLDGVLVLEPAAFIYQPRAQYPLGHALTATRLAELADILRNHDDKIAIIEDDNLGPLSATKALSLGKYMPERVIFVRAYCKTYGVDLRTTVIGGARSLVERIGELRSHGTAMNSRILQDALAHLIRDSAISAGVERARARYAARRRGLAQALGERGLETIGKDGFNLWLRTEDEYSALLDLAAFGIRLAPGRRCFIEPKDGGFLRIATSRLPDDFRLLNQLAELISEAVKGRLQRELN